MSDNEEINFVSEEEFNKMNNFGKMAEIGKAIRFLTSDKWVEIQRELLNITCEILKVTVSDIDLNENITEYGFDPVGLTELANRINKNITLK